MIYRMLTMASLTVVAAFALYLAVRSGLQAAIMAPTEILAEQHYRKLSVWFEPLHVPVPGPYK